MQPPESCHPEVSRPWEMSPSFQISESLVSLRGRRRKQSTSSQYRYAFLEKMPTQAAPFSPPTYRRIFAQPAIVLRRHSSQQTQRLSQNRPVASISGGEQTDVARYVFRQSSSGYVTSECETSIA